MRKINSTIWILLLALGTSFAQFTPILSNTESGEVFRTDIQLYLVRADNLFRQGNQIEALLE
ncbi:MAG: hypothetical protein AAGJ18_29055, partial [Bacteroidota bacterium]